MLKQVQHDKMGAHGFTLIELLVVVLIIGILAAVALPQYNKAVARARYSELMALTNSLYQQEQLYFMENGVWAKNYDELNPDFPEVEVDANRYTFRIPGKNYGFNIMDGGSNNYVYSQIYNPHLSYVRTFDGEKACIAYNKNDAVAVSVCKALGTWKSDYGDATIYTIP